MKATLNAQPRTIQIAVVGALTLASLVVLTGYGAGGNAFNIFSAGRKPTTEGDDPTQITVDIPGGIDLTDGLTSLEVTAEVVGMTGDGYLPEGYPHAFASITDDDRVLITSLASV